MDNSAARNTPIGLRWHPALEEVFLQAVGRTQVPMTSNIHNVAAALLILTRQGEEGLTVHDVVEFVHSNFAPRYTPPQADSKTPQQRRWIGFDWQKWYGYVLPCVKALQSNSPLSVFDVHVPR